MITGGLCLVFACALLGVAARALLLALDNRARRQRAQLRRRELDSLALRARQLQQKQAKNNLKKLQGGSDGKKPKTDDDEAGVRRAPEAGARSKPAKKRSDELVKPQGHYQQALTPPTGPGEGSPLPSSSASRTVRVKQGRACGGRGDEHPHPTLAPLELGMTRGRPSSDEVALQRTRTQLDTLNLFLQYCKSFTTGLAESASHAAGGGCGAR